MGNKIGLSGPVIRASDEAVKYLERMPGFLNARDMEQNVNAFRGMRAKDRETVLRHLRQRSIVNVFEVKRNGSPKVIELFRHVKHGPVETVETIPGYIYPIVEAPSVSELVHRGIIASAEGVLPAKLEEIVKSIRTEEVKTLVISNAVAPTSPFATRSVFEPKRKVCESCKSLKQIAEFPSKHDGLCWYPNTHDGKHGNICEHCLDRLYKVAQAVAQPDPIPPVHKEIEPMALPTPPTAALQTPKQKREYAERLLREAEEAEQSSQARDSINKQLAPLRLEANQSFGALYRAFEVLMEQMDRHEKVMAKIKEFKVE